jgi:hypothetical protein
MQRGLTPRSRRAPTAARARPGTAISFIVRSGPYTLRCRARLTSNVRPHRENSLTTRQSESTEAREAKRAESRRRSEAFQELWNQDYARAGRVLRAHLIVEHFINEYLSAINPHLGSLGEARLGFAQKLVLLGDHNPMLAMMRPGLQRLNQVRNRLAHRLSVEITGDDVATLMAVPLFAATYKASHPTTWMRKPNPIKALEEFSQLAGAMLQMMSEETMAGRPWLKNSSSAA